MAKRAKQTNTQVFLIISDRERRSELAKELRAHGLDVEEYQTAREFLIDKVNHQGGVVVASVRLMGLGGIELANMLKDEVKAFPVVLLAGLIDIPAAVKSEVDFVNDLSPENVLSAVLRITTPEVFSEKGLRWGFEHLSERETEALALIAKGLSNREIGSAMGISVKTAEAYRANISAKTRARDVAELLRMWKAWKALK